jgi:hypothetical protein
MRSLCAIRQKVPISGGKFPQTKRPFPENKKWLDFEGISTKIKEIRAK